MLKVKCNWCDKIFNESDIVYDRQEDIEYCPYCGECGYLMDLKDNEMYNDLLLEQQEQM